MKRLFLFGAVLCGVVAAAAETRPVEIHMVSVQAFTQGRAEKLFGPGLEEIQDVLGELKYDTFNKVRAARATADFNSEIALPINDRYSLRVTLLEKEASGRVRLKTCVEEKSTRSGKTNPINALQATSMLVPGDELVLGGPELGDGKLVIVLTLKELAPLKTEAPTAQGDSGEPSPPPSDTQKPATPEER